MSGIMDLPQVVQEATRELGDLFANEPQRRHFGEYVTGLMIAERKSVSGINREFAVTTDQSWYRTLPSIRLCGQREDHLFKQRRQFPTVEAERILKLCDFRRVVEIGFARDADRFEELFL